jgi:outer membrane protein assembly factor BamA
MQGSRHRQGAAVALAALWLLASAPAGGQQSTDRLEGRLIERVSFPGADEVSEENLRERLATQETRCRGILLQPFCWIADWDIVAERHHLETGQLPLDELRLRVVYFRAGYREADVASEVHELDDRRVEVAFRVDEGPPTILERVEVRQIEEVLTDGDLRRVDVPPEGDPFDLDQLQEAVDELVDLLGERGYLDGGVRDSIHVEGRLARVEITVEPGPPSVLREFQVVGNARIDNETILRGLVLEEGDVVTRPLLRRSVRTLHQSNLFHEVDVSVPPDQDSAKVVVIRVREAPPRLGRVGAGLNTLDFAQVEGRFTHYDWLGRARRFDVRGSVGNLFARQLSGRGIFYDILPGELAGVDESPFERPTWQVSAEFQQPHFRGAENVLGFGVFVHRQVVPAVSVDEGYGAELSFTRRIFGDLPASLSYRYEITGVRAGDVFFCVTFGICDPPVIETLRGRNVLSPLGLDLHLDRKDDPLAPTTGYMVRLDVEHASRFTLSDFGYNRISGEGSYYLPFGGSRRRHVVAGNLRFGWVRGTGGTRARLGIPELDQDFIHPRKRFYAGGARSVRGYAENQLGPRVLTIPREELLAEGRCTPEEIAARTCDPDLAPVDAFFPRPLGGSAVLEGAVEYRFPVGTVTGAVFVDGALVGGRLAGFLQDAARAVTPGMGVRFASPAGPIRIDLGIQPRLVYLLPVITELETETVNDVIERELVQLERRKRFDPLEDAGFVGQVLGRLTLHFSIGEAF